MDLQQLFESGFQAVIAASGGGSRAISRLLSTAGASNFILESIIPYSSRALSEYLGSAPEQAVSEATADAMAAQAIARAKHLGAECPLGVGCTAALRTTRKRRGNDRARLCIISAEHLLSVEINFKSNTRDQQEDELADAILQLLLHFTEKHRTA